MAGTGSSDDDDQIISSINVTPLVDVVLVLLIILMVTATAIVSKTIPMELPTAAGANDGEPPLTLAVSVEQGGAVLLDGSQVDLPTLRERVRTAREQDPEVRAVIQAAPKVKHREVVTVIDLLRQERVTKFAINVVREPGTESAVAPAETAADAPAAPAE